MSIITRRRKNFHQTTTYHFTKLELEMLAALDEKLRAEMTGKPLIASREYSTADRIPSSTLVPQTIRHIVKSAIRDLSCRQELSPDRAKALESYVVNNIKLNGVPFILWEADPSTILRAPIQP